MKIRLIIAPQMKNLRSNKIGFPLIGLCYLKAAIKKQFGNIDIKVVDLSELDLDYTYKYLAREQPDIVGFTCMTDTRDGVLKTAALAKKANLNSVVVLGGIHASIMSEQLLSNYSQIDIIAHCEGERTFCNLLKEYLGNSKPNLHKVTGISFREDDNIIKTPSTPLIDNLDEIPFPDYGDFNLNDYSTYFYCGPYTKQVNGYSISTSRGCPYYCNYCSVAGRYGQWRKRSPGNIVDEMEGAKNERGIKYFQFVDDCFTVSKERIIHLSQEIIDRRLNIKWWAQTRVETLDYDMLVAMKDAGCMFLQLGVESGSPRILKAMNKRTDLNRVAQVFNQAKNVGMATNMNILIGMPGETKETIAETINFIKKVKPSRVLCSLLLLYPGTGVYDYAVKKGFIADSYWLDIDNKVPLFTDEHSEHRLIRFSMTIYLKYYFSSLKGIITFLDHNIAVLRRNWRYLLRYLKLLIYKE